jgi:hypothetical protein
MNKATEGETIERLDRMIQLLEDLFILQGSVAQMKRKELRTVVGLDMKRVNRISKHVKVPMDDPPTPGSKTRAASGTRRLKK